MTSGPLAAVDFYEWLNGIPRNSEKLKVRVRRVIPFIAALAAVFGPAGAWTDEYFRPLSFADYPQNFDVSEMVRVPNAKLAWADFAALRRDFVELRSWTNDEIARWILDTFARVDRGQLKLIGIRNTAFEVDEGNVRKAIRPKDYNRAAVMETGLPSGGVVDIKGVGHREGSVSLLEQLNLAEQARGSPSAMLELRNLDHSDGLMSFGETIAETTRQRAAQRLFDLKGGARRFQSVETYFVISLPFEILKKDGTSIPAAIYGRQGHIGRAPPGLPVPEDLYIDPKGGRQRSLTGSAVDFGGVIIEDARLRSNFGTVSGGIRTDPQHSLTWLWAHNTADAFYYRNDSGAVYRHVKEMLQPIEKEWSSLRQAKVLRVYENPLPGRKASSQMSLFDKLARVARTADTASEKLMALEALEYSLNPKAVALASEFLQDSALAEGAFKVIATNRSPEAYRLMDALIEKFTKEPSPANARNLNRLARSIQAQDNAEIVPILNKLLKIPDEGLQAGVAPALAQLRKASPAITGLILESLKHPNEDVRIEALNAVVQRGQESELMIIESMAGKSDEFAARAASALNAPGGHSGTEKLLQLLLKSPDPDIAEAAAISIKGYRGPKTVELLDLAMAHKSREVRGKVLSYFVDRPQLLHDPEGRLIFAKILKDPSFGEAGVPSALLSRFQSATVSACNTFRELLRK